MLNGDCTFTLTSMYEGCGDVKGTGNVSPSTGTATFTLAAMKCVNADGTVGTCSDQLTASLGGQSLNIKYNPDTKKVTAIYNVSVVTITLVSALRDCDAAACAHHRIVACLHGLLLFETPRTPT